MNPIERKIDRLLVYLEQLSIVINTKQNILDEYRLMSQKEVERFFQITKRTTLIWTKKGDLKPLKIQGKLYYKLSDIYDLINHAEKR